MKNSYTCDRSFFVFVHFLSEIHISKQCFFYVAGIIGTKFHFLYLDAIIKHFPTYVESLCLPILMAWDSI